MLVIQSPFSAETVREQKGEQTERRRQKPKIIDGKRLVDIEGTGSGREMDWDFGVSGYKLLHIKWINDKVLRIAQVTIQYLEINHNGKRLQERKYVCV